MVDEPNSPRELARANIERLKVDISQAQSRIEANLLEAQRLRDAEHNSRLPKWEYTTADDIGAEELTHYGELGWELVNALSYTTGFGLGGNSSMTVHFRFIFKRLLPSSYSDGATEFMKFSEEWSEEKLRLEGELEQAQKDWWKI